MIMNNKGFSLIELMIVLAIIGILGTIGYPGYDSYMKKSRRADGKIALQKMADRQERFYLQNQQFGDMDELGYDDPWITDSDSYSVTVTASNAADFTARATYRLGGDEELKCNWFEINGAGVKSSDPDTDCWTRAR